MKLRGTNISMIRGDDETLLLRRERADGSLVPFTEGESLTLTVREDTDSPILLQTRAALISTGEALFTIAHADTAGLDFGRWVYDIQYESAAGSVSTYVPLSKFVIEKEVTF